METHVIFSFTEDRLWRPCSTAPALIIPSMLKQNSKKMALPGPVSSQLDTAHRRCAGVSAVTAHKHTHSLTQASTKKGFLCSDLAKSRLFSPSFFLFKNTSRCNTCGYLSHSASPAARSMTTRKKTSHAQPRTSCVSDAENVAPVSTVVDGKGKGRRQG